MNQRNYNITFSLHTVSSIVISAAAFIIFFAGAFSFFKTSITNWERGHVVHEHSGLDVNIDTVLDHLASTYTLAGRDVTLYEVEGLKQVGVILTASKDTTLKEAAKTEYITYQTEDFSTATYAESYTLGNLLYRLHFFDQIPMVGRYLSGLVAFFLLFAVITGLVLHWDKIKLNFYVFRPGAKWKTIWTDSHTVLGLIGFPFQFVYALTGAYFFLKILSFAPFVVVNYGNDQNKLGEELNFYDDAKVEYLGQPAEVDGVDFNRYVTTSREKWPNFNVSEAKFLNYGDASMKLHVNGQLDYSEKMNSSGKLEFDPRTGEATVLQDPYEKVGYIDAFTNIVLRIHYGDYAGLGLRVVSFLLGLLSCYVVLSGVMIWLVARTKKKVPEKTQRFNRGLTYSYLAICLGMFPTTALAFVVVKFYPNMGMSFVYKVYFLTWLASIIALVILRNNYKITKWSLLMGAVLSLLVPLSDLVVRGWSFELSGEGMDSITLINFVWLVLSVAAFYAVYRMEKNKQPPKAAKPSPSRMKVHQKVKTSEPTLVTTSSTATK